MALQLARHLRGEVRVEYLREVCTTLIKAAPISFAVRQLTQRPRG